MARKILGLVLIGVTLTAGVGMAWQMIREQVAPPLNDVQIFTFSSSGFIREVREEQDGIVLVIDRIQILSGEEAVSAVMEDMSCSREHVAECVPSMNDDFYIRRLGDTVRSHVAADARVQIMENPGSPVLTDISITEFPMRYRDRHLLLWQLPFHFLERDGRIIEVEEQ